MKLSIILSGILVGVAMFIGCGGSSGSPSEPTLKVGYLVDSPIVGVSYKCGDISAKTVAEGKFECKVASRNI